MTYNPSIPQATDNLSVSQGQMLTNFGQLNTLYGLDHVTFNNATSANRGYHQKVTFVGFQSDPVGISYPYSVLYTKAFGTAPNQSSELYFAEKRETTAQILYNLVPTIKAYGRVKSDGTGSPTSWTLQTTNSLQVNIQPSGIVGTSAFSFNVIFTNALDYDTYSIFFTINTNVLFPAVVDRSQSVNGFSVDCGNFPPTTNNIVTFMVI